MTPGDPPTQGNPPTFDELLASFNASRATAENTFDADRAHCANAPDPPACRLTAVTTYRDSIIGAFTTFINKLTTPSGP